MPLVVKEQTAHTGSPSIRCTPLYFYFCLPRNTRTHTHTYSCTAIYSGDFKFKCLLRGGFKEEQCHNLVQGRPGNDIGLESSWSERETDARRLLMMTGSSVSLSTDWSDLLPFLHPPLPAAAWGGSSVLWERIVLRTQLQMGAHKGPGEPGAPKHRKLPEGLPNSPAIEEGEGPQAGASLRTTGYLFHKNLLIHQQDGCQDKDVSCMRTVFPRLTLWVLHGNRVPMQGPGRKYER